ncbi:MAG: sortase-like acyltransferase [bacterium]|nr:sortase-like acyltransferase [bacterium]
MKVRAFEDRDRNELVRLVRLMFPDVDVMREMDELMARLDRNGLFVIAREDGRLGGYVEAGTRSYAEDCETSPVAYVEAWYVDEDLRRQRWGAKLFAAVESWARERGHTELASDAQLTNNVSIAAHKSLGFRETERLVCFAKRL